MYLFCLNLPEIAQDQEICYLHAVFVAPVTTDLRLCARTFSAGVGTLVMGTLAVGTLVTGTLAVSTLVMGILAVGTLVMGTLVVGTLVILAVDKLADGKYCRIS